MERFFQFRQIPPCMNSGRGMSGSDSVPLTECVSGILLPIRCYTCNRVTGTVNTEKKIHGVDQTQKRLQKTKEMYLLQSLLKSTRLDSSEANSISRRTRGALKSKPNAGTMASIPRANAFVAVHGMESGSILLWSNIDLLYFTRNHDRHYDKTSNVFLVPSESYSYICTCLHFLFKN